MPSTADLWTSPKSIPAAGGNLADLPPGLTLPLPLFALFVAVYCAFAPRFATEKQRAYVLSTLSSASMTLASLPFVYGYATGGIERMWYYGQNGWTKVLADCTVAFFGTYLFSDLVIGFFAYRKQVGLLTGWIHHIVYLGVMVHCATSLQSCVFVTAAVMELPTFDLAISSLFPSVRSDERFLTLMLLTRILFNAVLLADALRPSSRRFTEDSWVPSIILALALSLHASWMRGGVIGYLKRRAKAKAAAKAAAKSTKSTKATKAAEVNGQAEAEAELGGLEGGERVNGKERKPPHLDLGGTTPDDSPLVTPYAAPADEGLFSGMAIPGLPGIHALPAIPKLSSLTEALPQAKAGLSQLHLEFREAVHARLEEHRERLAQHGFLRRRNVYADGGEISE